LKDASKSLEEMKAKRIAARQADLDIAVAIRNLNKMEGGPPQPLPAGSFLRAKKSTSNAAVKRLLLEAKIAQDCNYDRKKFRQQLDTRR
jgi:hypothetical protein